MKQRRIGPFDVGAIGLGCMSLSYGYGAPAPAEQAERVLLTALDLGVTHFDTAALYGFGVNEALLGRMLAPQRSRFRLASKCGMTGVDGVRVIDNRPATLKATCDEALARLRTDHIDLYYLHRWDRKVPIEDSVGALADLVRAGKIGAIGLSEVSAATIRRAHAVHPIAAVQSEYSPWSREVEIGVLDACREVGAAFVAFSPVARGFLTSAPPDVAMLHAKDLRRGMPRFTPEHWPANLALLPAFQAIAAQAGCTPAQLSLAWVLSRGEHVVAIPGTTSVEHLRENAAAADIELPAAVVAQVDAVINRHTVSGPRYNEQSQADVDTETFATED